MSVINIIVILAVIVLATTIIKAKKHIYDIKKSISILLIGMTISLAILIYPSSGETNIIGKIFFCIIYSAQTIFLNENVELINSIPISGIVDAMYIGMIYILSLLMPLLTVSFLLSLIDDFASKLKIYVMPKEKVVIFSEFNEKAVSIARKIYNKKTTIIFANFKKETYKELYQETKKIKGIRITQVLENININKIKCQKIELYIVSDDNNENLTKTLKVIEKYKYINKKLKIYSILNDEISRIILDSTDKGNIQLEIVNEVERAILQLLQDKPLYLKSINNRISVLIVGCGKVGFQFLKTVTWCGQILGYKLDINIIDVNANKIKENMMVNYPELIENYNYNFIEADVNSNLALEELSKLKNINYIIITLNSDEANIKEAIFLRRYFLWQDKEKIMRKPIINIWIENVEKNKQVKILKNEDDKKYELNAFGSIKELYYNNPIINSEIENIAKQIHLSYNKNDLDFIEYYKTEYNIRSSRASAAHIKYKLYSVLGDNYTGQIEKDIEIFNELIKDEEILSQLAKNEHDRWNAYMRSEGFKRATVEEVQKYKKITNSYQYPLAKLHPAIVEYNQLDEVGKKIGKDLKRGDEDFIKNMGGLFKKKKTYNPKPIDTSDIILNNDILELSEIMAKNVHEVWAENRIKDGWKYGKKRDDAKKEHPCLVSYDELTESEKEYDRKTLQESLKVLIKLGYKIIK